jgi:hypothetical protein
MGDLRICTKHRALRLSGFAGRGSRFGMMRVGAGVKFDHGLSRINADEKAMCGGAFAGVAR